LISNTAKLKGLWRLESHDVVWLLLLKLSDCAIYLKKSGYEEVNDFLPAGAPNDKLDWGSESKRRHTSRGTIHTVD